MWHRYGLICHKGASTQEFVVEVAARDIDEARKNAEARGFTPLRQCISYVRPIN